MNKKISKNNYLKINFIFIYIIYTILAFSSYTRATEISDYTISTETTESATSQLSNPVLHSKADILLDAKTGSVLYENHSREKLYPASTTKLITAILTMENCQLTDNVTIKKEWLNGIPASYTIASLQPGETLTVDQLLHVLLIPSANDAANALACHIAGSIDNFAVKMNEKAIEIGCENTHFVNPSGIHNDDHYSTAYDMALIGKYATKFDTITNIATMLTYSLPDLPDGKKRTFKATNTLITPKNQYYYEYATGLKTGYTDKAKSCIVATAKKDDIELLCVVLGGEKTEDKKAQRELDCKALFDYGFSNFKCQDLCIQGTSVDKTQITDLPDSLKSANLIYSETLNLLVPQSELTTSTIHMEPNNKLPIMKNSVVGTITYHVNGKDYTVNILAGDDILPNNSGFMKTLFYLLIGFFVVVTLMSLIRKKNHRKKDSRYFRHSFY